MNKIRIALVAGHSHSAMGAENKTFNINEWVINKTLIGMIVPFLNKDIIEPILIDRDLGSAGYRLLPKKINSFKPDYILEFHDNSSVSGTRSKPGVDPFKLPCGNEVLYYSNSNNSKELAEIINNTLFDTLNIKDRGLKPISSSKENGYHLLRNTAAPCVIVEPAFFSNDMDTSNLLIKYNDLAINIANTLNSFAREKL